MRRLVAIALGASSLLLAADEAKQPAQVVSTERMDFASGGTLRLKNSTGELTLEGWDQPGVEITTIKTTKAAYDSKGRERAAGRLARIRIAAQRHGDELTIATDFPEHFLPTRIYRGATSFDLEYRIKAPRNARLAIDHDMGEVHIDGIAGEIHATDHMGLITVRLPEDGKYAIDAKSKLGAVDSDFAGHEAGSQKLYLRMGYGDIIVLKAHKPRYPAPLLP